MKQTKKKRRGPLLPIALDPRSPIAVKAGQFYRVRRRGKPARFVRIKRVTRTTPRRPPTVSYEEYTRTGRRKSRASIDSPLTWLDGAWRMRSSFELVEAIG